MNTLKAGLFFISVATLTWWVCERVGGYRTIKESIGPVEAQMMALQGNLFSYFHKHGFLPQGSGIEVALALLQDQPEHGLIFDWSRRKGNTSQLLDPWGTPVLLRVDGNRVNVRSAGKDGEYGTADDFAWKACY